MNLNGRKKLNQRLKDISLCKSIYLSRIEKIITLLLKIILYYLKKLLFYYTRIREAYMLTAFAFQDVFDLLRLFINYDRIERKRVAIKYINCPYVRALLLTIKIVRTRKRSRLRCSKAHVWFLVSSASSKMRRHRID